MKGWKTAILGIRHQWLEVDLDGEEEKESSKRDDVHRAWGKLSPSPLSLKHRVLSVYGNTNTEASQQRSPMGGDVESDGRYKFRFSLRL